MRHPVAAAHVRTVQTPQATLIIDYRTGAIATLSGDALTLWQALHADPPAGGGTSELNQAVADLIGAGWLVTEPPFLESHPAITMTGASASWGTQEVATQLDPHDPAPPWRWRLAAVPVVLLVLVVRQLAHRRRFARMIALTRLAAWLPPATATQTGYAVRAVRRAARHIPARVACLEESVSAALLLTLSGRHGVWCHGIATDPVRLHAWLADSDGHPIAEPEDTCQYTTIVSYPAPRRKGDHHERSAHPPARSEPRARDDPR